MAHFYGWLQGSRGVTTRTGGASSGIWAKVQSWSTRVQVNLSHSDGEGDVVTIYVDSDNKAQRVFINGEEMVLLKGKIRTKSQHIVEEL